MNIERRYWQTHCSMWLDLFWTLTTPILKKKNKYKFNRSKMINTSKSSKPPLLPEKLQFFKIRNSSTQQHSGPQVLLTKKNIGKLVQDLKQSLFLFVNSNIMTSSESFSRLLLYFHFSQCILLLQNFPKNCNVRHMTATTRLHCILDGTKYSRTDQVKFVEDSL